VVSDSAFRASLLAAALNSEAVGAVHNRSLQAVDTNNECIDDEGSCSSAVLDDAASGLKNRYIVVW